MSSLYEIYSVQRLFDFLLAAIFSYINYIRQVEDVKTSDNGRS